MRNTPFIWSCGILYFILNIQVIIEGLKGLLLILLSCFIAVKAGVIVSLVAELVGCAVLCFLFIGIWRKKL